MTGILLIVIVLLAVLIFVSRQFLRFSFLFSGKLVITIFSIYILLGAGAFTYLTTVKEKHIKALPKQAEEELVNQNEQLLQYLNNGELTKIDPAYVSSSQVLEVKGAELYYKTLDDMYFTGFIQYRDDLNANEIRVTTYNSFFSLNGYDMTKEQKKSKIEIVNDVLYVTSSYYPINVVKVSAQLSPVEYGLDFDNGFYAIDGSDIVFIEAPRQLTVHYDEYALTKVY